MAIPERRAWPISTNHCIALLNDPRYMTTCAPVFIEHLAHFYFGSSGSKHASLVYRALYALGNSCANERYANYCECDFSRDHFPIPSSVC